MYEQQVARVVEHGQWTALIMNWPSLLLSRVQCSICKKKAVGVRFGRKPQELLRHFIAEGTRITIVLELGLAGGQNQPHTKIFVHTVRGSFSGG